MGFWQNKHGQALIRSLNSDNPTQLGNWLAATFPNMYGVDAGDYNLTGLDADGVADFYINLFMKIDTPDANPAKAEAQAMAVAFAIYVTNQTLAGDTASAYGFDVTEHGVGIATWNVGSSGAAFGVEDDTEMTVLDIMLAADSYAVNGCLYNLDIVLRSLANEVFTAINEVLENEGTPLIVAHGAVFWPVHTHMQLGIASTLPMNGERGRRMLA